MRISGVKGQNGVASHTLRLGPFGSGDPWSWTVESRNRRRQRYMFFSDATRWFLLVRTGGRLDSKMAPRPRYFKAARLKAWWPMWVTCRHVVVHVIVVVARGQDAPNRENDCATSTLTSALFRWEVNFFRSCCEGISPKQVQQTKGGPFHSWTKRSPTHSVDLEHSTAPTHSKR